MKTVNLQKAPADAGISKTLEKMFAAWPNLDPAQAASTQTLPIPRMPPDGETPPAPGPIRPSDIRTLYILLEVHRSIGWMEHAVQTLEDTSRHHGEKIEQLIRQADRTEFSLGLLDRQHVTQEEKIKRLDSAIFAVQVIGLVLAGSSILWELARYFFNLP